MKIIVVDDEPLTRSFLKEQLQRQDEAWEVVGEAMDGQEAIELLGREEVDLIITDIKMPVMGGLDLCRWVAERGVRRKIVILSGFDEFSLAREAMRYGVKDYLLKPIVARELFETVRRLAGEIAAEKDQALAYRALLGMSEDSRRLVVQNLLKAIVTDSHVEIKALYPLLYKFKISLIESLGFIMAISLDIESVVAKPSIPASDIPLFQFILSRIAEDLADGQGRGRVFLDEAQNTNILLTGDDEAALLGAGRRLYADIAAAMSQHTGLTVTGAIGTPAGEVLQLGASGHEARRLLLSRVWRGGGALYAYGDESRVADADIDKRERALRTLRTGLATASGIAIVLLVKEYAATLPDLRPAALRRAGVQLVAGLAAPPDGGPAEFGAEAVRLLRAFPEPEGEALTMEETAGLLLGLVRLFAPLEKEDRNEHDVVSRAKAYIYSHYAEPLSLALIAEKIGVSSGYLSSIFHQGTDESYIKFLSRVRMEQAARLLRARPIHKVYDVAEMVGYVSVKHFSYVFKQHFGMPPGEYQNQHGHGE